MLKEKPISSGKKLIGKKQKSKILGKVIFGLLFIIVTAAFAWSFISYQEAKNKIAYLSSMQGKAELSEQEVAELLAKVGGHIILPEEEEPMIATIQDVESLKVEQPFFEKAQNGDQLIIYSDKAIVYSEERDVLVNVGPVYMQNQAGEASDKQSAKPVPTKKPVQEQKPQVQQITLDIRNGSKTVGVGGELGKRLADKDEYGVINISNAANTDYTGIILVNLKGKDLGSLEKELGVKGVSAMPGGEAESRADAVIIIGNVIESE